MHLNTPGTNAEVQDDILCNSCVSFGLHLWQTGKPEKQFYGQLETSCYNDNHQSEGLGKENTQTNKPVKPNLILSLLEAASLKQKMEISVYFDFMGKPRAS